MLLKNKVALLTGAAGGIGSEMAFKFVEEGANIVLSDVNLKALEILEKQIAKKNGKVFSIKMDVANEDEVKSCFQAIKIRYNTLDILVNNAGICKNLQILDISSEEWDDFMRINLKSVFLCSKEAFKIMKERNYGKIINMGSAAGKIGGVVAGAHYSAAKAGVICFTKSLALQAAPFNINVNAIAPGPISTRMTEEWGEELNRSFVEKIPFKRYGKPAEVAEVALFLASDKASFITGETINVNGGLLMD